MSRVIVAGFVVALVSACGTSNPIATPSATLTSASPAPTNTLDRHALIKETASQFYNEYMSCMTTPPTEAAGEVGGYCQSHNSYATPELPAHLAAGGVSAAGADPVVCAQSFPMSLSVDSTSFDANHGGKAIVVEKFGAGDVSVDVVMTDASGAMLVDNIVCPTP